MPPPGHRIYLGPCVTLTFDLVTPKWTTCCNLYENSVSRYRFHKFGKTDEGTDGRSPTDRRMDGQPENILHQHQPASLAGQSPINRKQSQYLRIADMTSRRRLRSSASHRLEVPPVRLSAVGKRAFPVSGAKIVEWRQVTLHVTSAQTFFYLALTRTFLYDLRTIFFFSGIPCVPHNNWHYFGHVKHWNVSVLVTVMMNTTLIQQFRKSCPAAVSSSTCFYVGSFFSGWICPMNNILTN